jgi:Ca-activated chloride channel family protein
MSAVPPARALARALPLVLVLVAAAPVADHSPPLGARPDPATTRDARRFDVLLVGTVKDASTGRPIEGAQVLVQGGGKGTVTAASGTYQLLVPGIARGAKLVVVARRIGYQNVEREVRADSVRMTVDFALAAATTTLSAQQVVTEQAAGAKAVLGHGQGGRGQRREMLARDGVAPAAAPAPVAGAGLPGDVSADIRRRSAPWNTEEYAHVQDNPFLGAKANPLSTFSIDVDRASYANVRRFLAQGQRPPKDAVRIEELVNYFRYDYAGPSGRHPVAIHTELAPAPWQPAHRLLRIGVQGKKIDLREAPPNNLVFLIDVSGSMQPENKLPLLKRAFRLLVDELREQDRVAIVVYAGAAGLVLPPTSGAEKTKLHAAIEALEAGGSTAGGQGIQLAYEVARRSYLKAGNNRVILATDGDFNVGVSSTSELVRLVEEKREQGTFLTVLGFGMGNYKDGRLEQLADKGNGNYAYIDDLLEAKKTLVTELGGTLVTIAKDVKLQVEFNPARVAAYRLIGYENRLLRAEDFNDDRKDAGELGAGHTVTALYEIVPVGVEGTVRLGGVDSLRYVRPAPSPEPEAGAHPTGSGELAYVKLRYKEPTGSTSRLMEHAVADRVARPSVDFTFAAAVAGFGMLLRDSEHKGNADWRLIARLAREGQGEDAEGYRAEFLRIVEGVDPKELAGGAR